ncbi:MAG: DUF2793 domain-containing protein [Pararhodobacter sp.]
MPAQAQKHVTHNEALMLLDLMVQMGLQALEATDPPPAPEAGHIWALGPAPSGAWAGQGGKLAAWVDGDWLFVSPRPGWCAALIPDSTLRLFNGTDWVALSAGAVDNLAGLGVNTSHDATNRLAVASPASLFSHEGAGHQLKIDKANAGDTASLLFQTGFSGRAEMGTAGNDHWSLKVSSDGTNWHTALEADHGTGEVTLGVPLPLGSGGTGAATATAARGNLGLGTAATATVTTTATDTTAGRLLQVGDHGLGTTGNLPNGLGLRENQHPVGWFRNHGAMPNRDDAPYGDVFYTYRVENIGGGTRRYTVMRAGEPSYTREVSSSGQSPWRLLAPLRGSNANGEFVRFADGTQICWRLYIHDFNSNSTATVDYPAVFSGGDETRAGGWSGTATNGPNMSLPYERHLTAYPHSSSVWRVRASFGSPVDEQQTYRLWAIGRWF